MPVTPKDNMKAHSPSPLIQRVVDQSWGGQSQNNTTAQQAIADQFNKHPVPPGDQKATK